MLQAKLASDAAELRRQIYASLPFTTRLAHLWLKLAYSDAEMLGSLAYAAFLAEGVTGIEDIEGMPSLDWAAKKGIKGPRDLHKLPRGLGFKFGRIAIGTALQYLSSELRGTDAMDEAVGFTVEKLLQKKYVGKLQGKPLKSAQSYIIGVLKNEVLDYMRRYKVRRTAPMVDDENKKTLNFSDPAEFLNLTKQLTQNEIRKVIQEISQVSSDPRTLDIVRLLMEGYKKSEVAKELGISNSAVSHWLARNRPGLQDVLQKYLA